MLIGGECGGHEVGEVDSGWWLGAVGANGHCRGEWPFAPTMPIRPYRGVSGGIGCDFGLFLVDHGVIRRDVFLILKDFVSELITL